MIIGDFEKISGIKVYGDKNQKISGIGFFDKVNEGQIAIIQKKKQIEVTRAKVILMETAIINTDKTILMCDELDAAAVDIVKMLIEHGIYPKCNAVNYSMKNGYYIGDDVRIDTSATIFPGVYIGNCVTIGRNVIIEPNVVISNNCVINDDIYIGSGTVVGAPAHYTYMKEGNLKNFCGVGKTIVSSDVSIGCNTVIEKGTFGNTVIGKGTQIGHSVNIGHDVYIGENCKVASGTGVAGNAVIGNGVTLYTHVGIAPFVKIGDGATVLAKTGVSKNVKENDVISGFVFARNHLETLKINAFMKKMIKED